MPVVLSLEVAFEITSVALCLVIFFILIGIHYCGSPYNHPKPNILTVTLCAMIMYIISMLISIYIHFDVIPRQIHLILNGFILITWHCGQILCYILFILRIYHAFLGSKYELTLCFYITFGLLIFLYIICMISWILTQIINNNESLDGIFSEKAQIEFNDIYAIGIELIDFILSIILIFMFINKVKLIAIDLNNNAVNSIVYDDPDKLLDITIKYFILGVIITISTQIEAILVCITWIGVIAKTIKNVKWFIRAQRLLFPLDCIINSIGLFLTFEMNDICYKKCCKCCTQCINKLCTKRKRKRDFHFDDKLNRVYSVEMSPKSHVSQSSVQFSLMLN